MKPVIYKNLIFTNHALSRMKNRKLWSGDIYDAVNYPRVKKGTGKPNTFKFIKTLRGRKMQVVANWKDDERKWLVISVWVRGEEDKAPLPWRIISAPFRGIAFILRRGKKK